MIFLSIARASALGQGETSRLCFGRGDGYYGHYFPPKPESVNSSFFSKKSSLRIKDTSPTVYGFWRYRNGGIDSFGGQNGENRVVFLTLG